MLLSESHLWWWNGPTFHHQFTTGPLDMANSTYVGTTLHGSVTGGGGGTNHKLVPAMPWGFFLFFFGGVWLFFKWRDLQAWHPTTPASSSTLGNQECGEPAVLATAVLLLHLHNVRGSTSTGATSGAWRVARGSRAVTCSLAS